MHLCLFGPQIVPILFDLLNCFDAHSQSFFPSNQMTDSKSESKKFPLTKAECIRALYDLEWLNKLLFSCTRLIDHLLTASGWSKSQIKQYEQSMKIKQPTFELCPRHSFIHCGRSAFDPKPTQQMKGNYRALLSGKQSVQMKRTTFIEPTVEEILLSQVGALGELDLENDKRFTRIPKSKN